MRSQILAFLGTCPKRDRGGVHQKCGANVGGSLKFGANFPRENNLFVLKCFFYKKADIYL